MKGELLLSLPWLLVHPRTCHGHQSTALPDVEDKSNSLPIARRRQGMVACHAPVSCFREPNWVVRWTQLRDYLVVLIATLK
ncbi:hypothetical protein BDW62DRAFT_3338 [Aspergillus aurantiobrunneus]